MAKKRNPANNKQVSGQVRIIAGMHRGRKLAVLNSDGLRPTTDRVKETLFNWLMMDVRDAICLDCYAGSGSLGFEALSRGARSVDFIEMDKAAGQQLKTNINLLKANNAKVHQGDCLSILPALAQKYELVFIDPPFRKGLAQRTIDTLQQADLLADQALVYVEVESEQTTLEVPQSWHLVKDKNAGQVSYRLYRLNCT
ncbi:16S rRNA (guanine(966)-N(2))-methyltransferase RsmD [Thalassotalea sp. HSM 43]|uniref:16S rRNA (guanine(966)-N(2))-methyltransferase RsmD n=1 Tax=Thalassotalea sp. HSM 43 TaxID=2552945 RepID=UPI001080BE96|nr:16S rRNA (guanine(966)-N(2))-methyltransferase RsmD [Thalassotalea sp. HSM 43]QBY04300.1 16S rRNA (guanine(966)-N(2))-methyltransferase RsmD [Thalassotalea sp. HSM 43]